MTYEDILNMAWRAVDACGGSYGGVEDEYADGHKDALDAALEAIDNLIKKVSRAQTELNILEREYRR